MNQTSNGVDLLEMLRVKKYWHKYCKIRECPEPVRRVRSKQDGKAFYWVHDPKSKTKKGFVIMRPAEYAKDGLCYWHWKEAEMAKGGLQAGRDGEKRGKEGRLPNAPGMRGTWGHGFGRRMRKHGI